MIVIDWHRYFSWTYSGVDHSLAGNGGAGCVNFLPTSQKIIETSAFVLLSACAMIFAWPRLKLPDRVPVTRRGYDRTGKRVLLLLHTLFFGIELGFKFSTRQMIWILNPCHLVTMMQVRYKLLYAIIPVHSVHSCRSWKVHDFFKDFTVM
jgi:hypothetical protein